MTGSSSRRTSGCAGADHAEDAPRSELLRLRNGTFGTVVAFTDLPEKALTREGDKGHSQGDVAHGTEAAVAEARRSLVVQLDDGRRAVLPRSYAETSTSLGYALTVFRSQGITVDHTFGLAGDSLYQEAGYTALSRGRLSNKLYVASPENPRWEIGHHVDDLSQRDPLEALAGALSLSKEQVMASEHLPTPSDRAEDVAYLRQPGDVSDRTALGAPDNGSDSPWLEPLWERVQALDAAGPDGADLTSAPDPPPMAWTLENEAGHDLDDGWGL